MDRQKLFKQLKKDDNGFVLITALMVIFLVMSIVVTVTLITAADLKNSARIRAVIETKIMAESVSDKVFASIARSSSDYPKIANAMLSVAYHPSSSNPDDNPLNSSYNNNTYKYGSEWFSMQSDGTIVKCDGDFRSKPCFKAKILEKDGTNLLGTTGSGRSSIILKILMRGGCIKTSGNADTDVTNCIYREFEQTFRERAYIEDTMLTQIESASPNVGVSSFLNPDVVYIGSDILQGSFYSNDNKQKFCHFGTTGAGGAGTSPKFNNISGSTEGLTDSAGTPLSITCDPTNSNSIVSFGSNKFLPQQIDNKGKDVSTSIATNTVFKSLATPGTLYNQTSSTGISIVMNNSSGLRIDGRDVAYPSNGVIFIDGDLHLKGIYSRKLTIAVTGNVFIDGDVEAAVGAMVYDGQGPMPSDAPILGVTSGNDIRIDCDHPSGQCENRYVVGVLSAPTGTIYNDNWNKVAVVDPDNPPYFHLYGAIVSYYHPVFGSFSSTSAGKVTKGWAKDLKFDDRLIEQQPPYFFRTTQASIVRSSIEGKGCSDGTAAQPTCP